jgi:hypothetical protein
VSGLLVAAARQNAGCFSVEPHSGEMRLPRRSARAKYIMRAGDRPAFSLGVGATIFSFGGKAGEIRLGVYSPPKLKIVTPTPSGITGRAPKRLNRGRFNRTIKCLLNTPR